MQNVRVIEGGGIEYPFLDKGDPATKVYRMVCEQLADYYDPAQVELDTTMSSAAAAGVIALPFTPDLNAYFVGDTNHSHEPGGMVRFERVFANIPKTTTVPIGAEAFNFPGVFVSQVQGVEIVGLTSLSVTVGTNIVTMNFSTPHGREVGELIYVAVRTRLSNPLIEAEMEAEGGYYYNPVLLGVYIGGYRTIQAASSNTISIQCERVFEPGDSLELVTDLTGVRKNTAYHSMPINRPKFTAASTVIENDYYYLPGITNGIDSFNDIPVSLTFDPIDNNFQSTEILSSTTIPSAEEYFEWVRAGDTITLDSSVSKWMGNIYKKTERKIKAI